MLDLLAQTDPLSVGGWLIMLVALGMYPVGILLPGCCGCGECAQCSGSLPNTVTVTFGTLADEIAGPYNHEVQFRSWYESPAPAETGPSFGYPYQFGYPYSWPNPGAVVEMGSGAVARVTTTGGAVFGTEGGITGVQLLSGGSGYAERGRAAPTLTIAGGSGTGATLTPTLSSSGSPTVWTLASVAASGGSGYVDGEALTITAAAGDTVVSKAAATVIARSAPTLTATGSGAGAEFSITLSKSGSPPTWGVATVDVTKAGSGYAHESKLTLLAAGAVTVQAASAIAKTLEEPSYTVDASGAGGTGATFAISYAAGDGTYWQITAISVTNGGSGYSEGGTVTLSPGTGDHLGFWPDSFDDPVELGYTVSGGAITSVSAFEGYGFYRDRGRVQSVAVSNSGKYYQPGGPAVAVTVTNGGQYYNEDPSLPPRVATVSTRVYPDRMGPAQPPLASHAKIRPTIDTNTASATFGQITGLTIDAAGAGYTSRTAWLGKRCCKPLYDGKSFVLQRATPSYYAPSVPEEPDWCVYESSSCNGWGGFGETYLRFVIPNYANPPGRSAVVPAGGSNGGGGGGVDVPRVAPRLPYLTVNTFAQAAPCRMYFESATRITDCSNVALTLEAGPTASATVAGGGTYPTPDDSKVCTACCPSGAPREITATLAYNAPPASPTNLNDWIWKSQYDYWQEAGFPVAPGAYVLQWERLPPQKVFSEQQRRWVEKGQWRFVGNGFTVSVLLQGCDEWFNQSTRLPGLVGEELLTDVYRNDGTRYTGLVQWDEHVGVCGSDCDRKCFLAGGFFSSGYSVTDEPTASTPLSSNGTTADSGYEWTSDYYTTAPATPDYRTRAVSANTMFLTKELCDRCQSGVCSLSGKTFQLTKFMNTEARVIATLTIT